jgi:hypothetical protein
MVKITESSLSKDGVAALGVRMVAVQDKEDKE